MAGINVAQLREAYKSVGGYTMSEEALIARAEADGRITKAEANSLRSGLNGSANWGKVGDSLEASKFDPSQHKVYEKEFAEAQKKKKPRKQTAADIDRQIAQNGAKTLVKILSLPFTLFTSCQDVTEDYSQHIVQNNYNTYNIKITEDSSIADLMFSIKTALDDIKTEIRTNGDRNNDNLQKLYNKLNEFEGYIVTIITNQEKNAKSAEEFYQQIINLIGKDTELLQIMVEKLTENNEVLGNIKALMQKNNAQNDKILEAVLSVKFGVDQLHKDNEEIKTLIKNVETAINKLPANLEAKFKGYLMSIIDGIGNTNTKVSDLIALVKLVNQNVEKGNKQQQEAAAKILAAIQAMNCNMTAGMNAILKAVNDGNSKIIANIDKILKLVETMDKNQEARNDKILKAIASLNGKMVEEFEKLVKIGDKNNQLTTETNKLINVAIELLGKMPNAVTDLSAVIKAIKETGASLNSSIVNLANLLKTVNENVVAGNKTNEKLLNTVISKLDGLDKDCVNYFKQVIEAIGKKSGQGVDLTKIEKQLDAILQAIKDHKVIIKGGCGCCNDENFCNDPVNEGVIEDLNWLLG